MSRCEPWWQLKNEECPYGTLLFGDVTFPKDVDIFVVGALIYSYVPFAVAGFFIMRFCLFRGTQDLFFLVFTALIVFCNEVVFKQLAAQYRPGQQLGPKDSRPLVGTCALTCGMPSSHASIAAGFYLVILFEYFSYVGTAKVSHTDFAFYFLLWTCVLLPVPYSREILHDHSTTQIVCGGMLGFCCAVAWIISMQVLQRRWQHKIGTAVHCGGVPVLRHTLPPPLDSIRGRSVDRASDERRGRSETNERLAPDMNADVCSAARVCSERPSSSVPVHAIGTRPGSNSSDESKGTFLSIKRKCYFFIGAVNNELPKRKETKYAELIVWGGVLQRAKHAFFLALMPKKKTCKVNRTGALNISTPLLLDLVFSFFHIGQTLDPNPNPHPSSLIPNPHPYPSSPSLIPQPQPEPSTRTLPLFR